jgi:predicted transcriptional regulator
MKQQVAMIAEVQHRSESDIVRDALAAYVAKSHPAP